MLIFRAWATCGMITGRIGRNEVLLPINHNHNKFCDVLALLKIKTHAVKKKIHLNARVRCHVLSRFLRHHAYCPLSAEIRTVDSQSDLRILL